MSSHEELVQLAEASCIGALDTNELARLEAHLAQGCDDCVAVMREAALVADELADAIEPMPVPGSLRVELMERVHADAANPRRDAGARTSRVEPAPTARRWQTYALAASVLAAAILGALLVDVSRDLEAERIARQQALRDFEAERASRAQAAEQLARANRDRERIELELAGLRGTLNALTASTTETIALAGAGPTPDASARAYLDPESGRLILYVYDLAQAPEGKNYQLWVIENGQPTSAGVLALGTDGAARHDTVADAALSDGVVVAITLEPEGGQPQPTGPIVLAGQ